MHLLVLIELLILTTSLGYLSELKVMELPSRINPNLEGTFIYHLTVHDSYEKNGNYLRLIDHELKRQLVKIDFNNPNFIHDGVCYALFGNFTTDARVKHLTPDFVGDNFILEVTTTTIPDENVLKKKLDDKLKKYSLVKGEKKLIVIVVSYESVVSNCEIATELQSSLISNFVNLKRLQAELLQDGKSYWVNTQESNFKRRLNNIIGNYTQRVKCEGDKRAFDMIDSIWDSYDYKKSIKNVFDEIADSVSNDLMVPSYLESKNNDIPMPEGGRKNLKRITVVPMICPKIRKTSEMINVRGFDAIVCKSKYKIITSGQETQNVQHEFAEEMKIDGIISGYYDEKMKQKKQKKGYQFKPELTPEELVELNLDGIMAKAAKGTVEVKQKRLISKEPFSIDVDIKDIEQFRLAFPSFVNEDIDEMVSEQCYPLMKAAYNCIVDANINLVDQGQQLIRQFLDESKSKLYNWLNFVSDLMFEINLSLRENTNKGFFIVKCLKRYDADIYIKTTKSNSHIFFFVVCKMDYFLSETLGPKFVTKDGIAITEWGSMLKRDLENFLNIKETVRSTFVCYDELFDKNHQDSLLNAKWLSLMILLNNKDRNEEIVTSLRYTYMKSLSLTEHSSTMNKKLGLIFRDRLQVYLTKKVINLNNLLSLNKPKVTFDSGSIEIEGLQDMFGSKLNFKEAINISYAGYIMTKVKQPQSNQASKMIEKILEYEIKYLSVKVEEISISKLYKQKSHCFDYEFVRTFCEMSKDLLIQSYGNQLHSVIENKIVSALYNIDFESISTLKASAKLNINGSYSEENLKELKSARPRVLANVVHLMDLYKPSHFIDLIEPCIKHIVENDSFNVELFPKDQHNGLREIYVVDIHVRIVQLFLETISRSLCSLFQSETLNHPKNSTALIPRVLKQSLEKNEKPFCLMKSGDASKWSQSQIVTKFYIVLKSFLPKVYHKIVKDSLSLWFDKKIFLPPALIESFMSTDFQTRNETLNDLREGKLSMIKEKGNMFMRVRSGFMQGILHHSSSLFHTIVQEGFRQVQFKLLRDAFFNTKYESYLGNIFISILQGSDDSSMSIMGDARLFNNHKEFFLSLMHLKDKLSYKFGIIPSAEKTATCVPFIIEYNSQWLALGKSIQPTIKFAMVSCQLPSTQSIIQRQEFYYNLLKDCLEKGCSTRTCFMIKLSQLSSHYNLLGCNNTSSFALSSKLLQECLNPSLGFFILEPVVATAVFGFDFSFYCHTQGALIGFLPNSYSLPYESNLPSGNTLRINAHISKTSWKKWKQLVECVGVLSDDEAKFLEDNAVIYYERTHDAYSSKIKIKQKIQDFDVKQSLASRYGITENMASFFCTFIKVCKVGKDKDSLIGWMLKCTEHNIQNLSHIFPKCELYNEILHYLSLLSHQSYLIDADYVQRGRSQVTVLHSKTAENELLFDTIKYIWFDLEIDEVTKSAYEKLFEEYQLEFDWLKSTEKETREHLNCSSRQLANFIRNVVGKNRTLTFYDTVAKGASYPYLLTRIFQKGKKIQLVKAKEGPEMTNDTIFSNLKVLLNLPYTESYKVQVTKELIKSINVNELIPREAHKYKILKLLINNNMEELQNELFKYSFDSHLTWYSKAQHFNKKTKEWEGEGCLTTVISFLNIKTHIQNNTIVKICVNDLHAFKTNLSTYFKIVKEQKLSFDDESGDDLKLSKLGLSKEIKGTIINITPELRVNLRHLQHSRLVFSNGNMKIVAPMCDNEQVDYNFENKQYNLQTLYLIESCRKARSFNEMRDANHKGEIIEEVWVDSLGYKAARDGPILKIRCQMGGRDVKVSTIMNFEVWKKITLPQSEKLFEWGELAQMIVDQESITIKEYVLKILETFPQQLPIDRLFEYLMEQNNFDKREFLNFISKVEFFQAVTDPDYDETVKKDAIEDEQENLIEALNQLMFDSSKMQQAITNTMEFNSCLTNLGDTITNASVDFSFHRFTIYGIKDTQTTFPSSLLYKVNHELKRQVPDEEELLTIISRGDLENVLTIHQKILLKLIFDTPLIMPSINTVRKLREYVLLGYTPKSTRSSRSSSRLGLYLPDNDLESKLIKRFKLSPKMENFHDLILEEISLTEEAILEISEHAEKTTNRRVKMPLITQLLSLQEDLSLLNQFRIIGTKHEEPLSLSESETKEEDNNSDSENDNSSISSSSVEQEDDKSSSELSADIAEEPDHFEFLKACYKYMTVPKKLYPLYIKSNPIPFLLDEKVNVDEIAKSSPYTFHRNGELIVENGQIGVEIWWEDDSDEFYIFSHKGMKKDEQLEKLIGKKVKSISSIPEGSCLFNAFSYLLSKKNKIFSQSELRTIVHNSDFELELDIHQHRKDILKNSTWGQEEDISALCHELNVSVVVVTEHNILKYNDEGEDIGILINYNNIHFDVME